MYVLLLLASTTVVLMHTYKHIFTWNEVGACGQDRPKQASLKPDSALIRQERGSYKEFDVHTDVGRKIGPGGTPRAHNASNMSDSVGYLAASVTQYRNSMVPSVSRMLAQRGRRIDIEAPSTPES